MSETTQASTGPDESALRTLAEVALCLDRAVRTGLGRARVGPSKWSALVAEIEGVSMITATLFPDGYTLDPQLPAPGPDEPLALVRRARQAIDRHPMEAYPPGTPELVGELDAVLQDFWR